MDCDVVVFHVMTWSRMSERSKAAVRPYDFPKDAKKYFVIQNAHPKKLNVNKLSLAHLRRHPYINYYMAKAITDYRRLHGPLTSLDDLRFSSDFPPEVIERLKPYVEF